MAGTPFFIVGANAKIKLNNKTLAYCTDLSYQVIVNLESPRVLGMYEPSSIEPVSYEVSGSFSVIRYARGLKKVFEDRGLSVPNDVSDDGNGVGSWGPQANNLGDRVIKDLGAGDWAKDGKADEAFIPSKLQNSTTFDIEIFQKTGLPGENEEGLIAKIRGAKLSQMSFAINKRSLATSSFSFKALYVDEDTFKADFSGLGQQNI